MKLLKNYKKIGIPAKAAIWFMVCSLLQRGISFITVPIFTRLLTTDQYGIYSLYVSWLQILTIITSLNLYCGVFNNGITKFEEDRNGYISSMQGLTTVITFIVFVVYSITRKDWVEFLGLSPFIIALMFLEVLVFPALQYWSGRQRFEYKYKKLVAVTLVKSVANPIIGICAVLLMEDKATAKVLSAVLVEVVFCGTIMISQFIKGRIFFSKKYWNYALKIAIPIIPHYLSGTILAQADRVMISKMVGTSEVALYSISYNIGMLVQLFTLAINNSFTPWMYQKIKSDNIEGVKKTVNMMLLLVCAIIFCVIMLGPELVLIFGSEEYASAVYVIPPVAASAFFIFLYNILAIPQFYFEKTNFLMFSSIAAAVVNIALNYIFIGLYGYVAAGYTTLTCYVLYGLGHYLISKKIIEKYLPGQTLFDIDTIVLLSGVVVTFGILSNLVFDYWLIRYSALVLSGIALLIKRSWIFRAIRDFAK